MKKIKNKKIIPIVSIAVIFFLVFVIFIPKILSTKFAKPLTSYILKNKNINELTYKNIKFTWFGPQKVKNIVVKTTDFLFSAGEVEINASLYKLFFKSLIKLNTSFKVTDGEILSKNLFNKSIILKKINGKIDQIHIDEYEIDLKAISSINNKSGNISINAIISNDKLLGNIDINNFPKAIVKELQKVFFKNFKNKEVFKLFGETINLLSKFDINQNRGPFELILNSGNFNLNAPFFFNRGTLNLSKDLKLEFDLSDELSSIIFKNEKINLIHSLSSYKPIKIIISKENFSLKINPLKFDEFTFNNLYIDLGKIKVLANDNLNSIINLLKKDSHRNLNQIDIWCTPTNLNLQNNILNIYRIDLLLDYKYHVCMWGKVNLQNKKLDMNLGLTSSALKKAFNIRGLPEDYVLRIPIKGTTNKIKIEDKSASKKIAALIAAQIAEKNLPFGDFIKIFKNIDTERDKIPRQAYPTPW